VTKAWEEEALVSLRKKSGGSCHVELCLGAVRQRARVEVEPGHMRYAGGCESRM
jgi:hypothetical protein